MKALDELMPEYEFHQRHWIEVQADRGRIDRAVREVTLAEIPIARALVRVRAMGQFWRLRGGRAGARAKAVIDFRAAPGELSTETRVHVAAPAARRKFARYWRVIRPFSGLLRLLLLRAAKRRDEAAG